MNTFRLSASGEILEETKEQAEQSRASIAGLIHRSGFGQRLPDGSIVWTLEMGKKPKH